MSGPPIRDGVLACRRETRDRSLRWLDDLKAGEGEAARRLWERYFDRLVHLARSELRARRREAAEDEEDAALSAFDSFCRARRGAGSRC